MNLQSLKPAGSFASCYGVKAIVYGPPGTGKTPIVNSAPRPLLLACEPGLLSMRGSNVPTFCAFTADALDEFFEWFFKSAEVKNFDTIAVDSVSHMADTYLQAALNGTSKGGNKKHGLQAYGDMATRTMNQLRPLYYMAQKHCYLIAKEGDFNGVRKPYFPGQQLLVDVPHLFDAILNLNIHNVPGQGQVKAFRCQQSIDIFARDRTGNLLEFEPPNFGLIVEKCMR